jgi:tripartite-type tricarboxylate transporter receptor subunit TctC
MRVATPLLVAALALPLLHAGSANAQTDYPSKPVRILVPWAPGGAVDVVTRKIAAQLTLQTGQTFFVENKAGATGTIGASQVAHAAPDGYTLLANDTTHTLWQHIFKTLPFDPDKDLAPVVAFNFAPMALAVAADSRFKTLADLLAEAKAKPKSLTYGSGGPGTTPHFATEAMRLAAGVEITHVPFKGAGEATLGLLSNTIDMQIASTPGIIGQVKGGKMRMLAISGKKRIEAAPTVPTFAEAGLKWNGVVNFTGVWVPKGTPPAVVKRLQQEIAKAVATVDFKSFAAQQGSDPSSIDGAAFAKLLADSGAQWGTVARSSAFERQ